jgi:hypothetical protein
MISCLTEANSNHEPGYGQILDDSTPVEVFGVQSTELYPSDSGVN